MWILYAFASAFFAGITAILAKIGIKKIDSHLATALRTVIIVVFSFIMVYVAGSGGMMNAVDGRSLIFLILSGLTTGGSWICYFKAIQLGDVNKVVPIDKTSTVLTMLLAFFILKEPFTLTMAAGMLFVLAGTYVMIQKKETAETSKDTGNHKIWIVYALLSAIFASMTSILAKIGISNVESNLGTAIRTVVVLIMAWLIVFAQKKQKEIKTIDRKSWIFISLSGLTTGLSWIFYYRGLQEGYASVVVPIDKLSIIVTVLFAHIFLNEKVNRRTILGLTGIVIGTLLIILKF